MVPVLSSATISTRPADSSEAAVLNRMPCLRADAVADHDRHRRRQTQRARAADDEHGDGARQRCSPRACRQQPDNRRNNCNRNDRGDKNAGDLVGHLWQSAAFGRRRVGDHLDDLRERRVLPTREARQVRKPDWLTVAAETVSPGALSAGMLSPVSAASLTALVPSSTTPSTGMLSPGRTTKMSPVLHLLDGDGLFLAASYNRRRFGRELHEAFERRPSSCPLSGPRAFCRR